MLGEEEGFIEGLPTCKDTVVTQNEHLQIHQHIQLSHNLYGIQVHVFPSLAVLNDAVNFTQLCTCTLKVVSVQMSNSPARHLLLFLFKLYVLYKKELRENIFTQRRTDIFLEIFSYIVLKLDFPLKGLLLMCNSFH